jgi:hypothetical protein
MKLSVSNSAFEMKGGHSVCVHSPPPHPYKGGGCAGSAHTLHTLLCTPLARVCSGSVGCPFADLHERPYVSTFRVPLFDPLKHSVLKPDLEE